jgi:DNA modification methylase
MDLAETPVADLKPYKQNARTHSPEQVRQIVKSIEQFGFTNPVLTDGKNRIVAGHGRVMAAKEMGLPTVPTIPLSHLTKAQLRAYVIADNKLALNAGWDEQLLSEELKGIDDSEIDIDLTGFSEDEIADLLKEDESTGSSEQDDNVPDTPENIFNVERGQIWQLGEHRLMCGDSTDKGDVDRLMDGQKADMVFTDPPYGIAVATNYGEQLESKVTIHRPHRPKNYRPVHGDSEEYDPTSVLEFFKQTEEIFLWGANNYAHRLPSSGEHGWMVWDKKITENGTVTLSSDFEICWSKAVHKYAMIKILWSGPYGHDKKNDGPRRVHPTQKPVKLAETFIERWGGKTKLLVDLFLGSGSTLIACEKTGRKCFGMEIDPHYCSVIINRWQEYTGKTAEPVHGG